MRTTITAKNLTTDKVKEAMSNPNGMNFQNTPEVRKAVKSEIDSILSRLQGRG